MKIEKNAVPELTGSNFDVSGTVRSKRNKSQVNHESDLGGVIEQ